MTQLVQTGLPWIVIDPDNGRVFQECVTRREARVWEAKQGIFRGRFKIIKTTGAFAVTVEN